MLRATDHQSLALCLFTVGEHRLAALIEQVEGIRASRADSGLTEVRIDDGTCSPASDSLLLAIRGQSKQALAVDVLGDIVEVDVQRIHPLPRHWCNQMRVHQAWALLIHHDNVFVLIDLQRLVTS